MEYLNLREVRLIITSAALAMILLASTLAYGIVHKVNNGDDIVAIARSNADQADRQSDEIAALRKQLDAQAAAFKSQLSSNRRQAAREAAVARRQNTLLIRALRKAGIPIPRSALISSGGGVSPKGRPAHTPHRSPGTRGHTGPPPITDLFSPCALLPVLCPFFPKE